MIRVGSYVGVGRVEGGRDVSEFRSLYMGICRDLCVFFSLIF